MKRKERPLTIDEIKDKIIQNTQTSWLHTDPLFGWAESVEGGSIIPLQNEISGKVMVAFLIDPLDYTTENFFKILTEWLLRYHDLPWVPVIVIRFRYHFLKNKEFFDRYRSSPCFYHCAVFLDENGDWFRAFGVEAPFLSLSEENLQLELRKKDPGLPLLELHSDQILVINETKILKPHFTFTGTWADLGGEAVACDENHSTLSFDLEGTGLRLAAMTYPAAREMAKAYVFLNDAPLPKNMYGAQIHLGDRGQAILEINRTTGIYEIIHSLENIKGKITFKFLNISENPVIVYGLRSRDFVENH